MSRIRVLLINFVLLLTMLFFLTGCSHKLIGKYTCDTSPYSIEFFDDGSFVMQGNYYTYEGTWKWDNNKKQYLLSMDSRYWIQGMISYTVEKSNGGLIINGGGIDNEFFTRE